MSHIKNSGLDWFFPSCTKQTSQRSTWASEQQFRASLIVWQVTRRLSRTVANGARGGSKYFFWGRCLSNFFFLNVSRSWQNYCSIQTDLIMAEATHFFYCIVFCGFKFTAVFATNKGTHCEEGGHVGLPVTFPILQHLRVHAVKVTYWSIDFQFTISQNAACQFLTCVLFQSNWAYYVLNKWTDNTSTCLTNENINIM